jgi:amidohydrolase
MDITKLPAVVSIGAINGGVRHNIIAETVEMLGTIRTFSPAMRQDIIDRIGRTVTHVAEAHGASGRLEMMPAPNPVLENDAALTERAAASLRAVLGDDAVETSNLLTVAEDFAHISQRVPSFYYWMGVTPPGRDAATAPDNHSDLFYVDEAALSVGMRTMLRIAVDYLQASTTPD